MRLVPILVALAGCWSEARPGAPTTPAAAEATAPPVRAAPVEDRDPTRAHLRSSARPLVPRTSVWTGHYFCSQGITAMTLRLAIASGEGEAIFEFGPHPDNPRPVQTGATKVRGPVTVNADGGFTLDLDPVEWVVQPPGYVMVGLTATADPDHRKMSGQMKNPNCGIVDLERLR